MVTFIREKKRMLEQTLVTLNALSNETIYCFLLINAFIEYPLPPFPADTIMVIGAYLAGTGKLDFLTVYLISLAGSLIGFLSLFFLGKHYGREFFFKKNYRFLSREMILRVEGWFQNFGIGLIAANRFIPGVRSAVALFAGISNMKFATTAAAAALSSLLWNSFLICGGYYLGKNWRLVLTILKHYNQAIIVVIVLFVSYLLWARKRRNA
jgi:membrane protein DedA with SNARE-associated domain